MLLINMFIMIVSFVICGYCIDLQAYTIASAFFAIAVGNYMLANHELAKMRK